MDQATTSPDASLSERLLRDMCEHNPVAVALVDPQGFVRYGNRQFRDAVAPGSHSLEGWHVRDLFSSIDALRWGQLLQQAVKGRSCSREAIRENCAAECAVELTLQLLDINGAGWVSLNLRPLAAEERAQGIQLLQREVLEAVAVGDSVAAIMDRLCRRVEALAPEVRCTVLRIDEQGRVRPCAAPSLPIEFSQAIDGEPIGPQAGSCGTAAWRGEPVEVIDIASDPLWEHYKALALPMGLAACWSSPIKLRNGKVAATFALYYAEPRAASPFHREMVNACVHLCSLALEHAQAEQRIHQLAFYDALTGLANMTLLRDRARRALARMARSSQPLAVLCLDIDRFKTINDSLGHAVGDRLLVLLADRLVKGVRPEDTVARLGGDEFVLMLPGIGPAQAHVVVERLMARVTKPITVDGFELNPTVSIGVSVSPDDGTDFDMLQRNADAAMYRAKAAGRNCARFFKAQMNEAEINRLEIETALRRAVTNGELTICFQPQIRLSSNTLHGFEALVRWEHPERGAVSPEVFIPIAEECGLVGAIDEFVLDQSCAQLARWREAGYVVPSMGVNLSAVEFQQGVVEKRVKKALDQYQLPPSALTIEITEGLLLRAVDETLSSLAELRALGVRLALDDFGTGFSSLSYLKRFPVDELKVDRSFIRDLATDEGDRALTSAIIQLGQNFGLTVIAEGVEGPDQLNFLADNHCAVAQGFHFSPGIPGSAATAWMEAAGACYVERATPAV